VGLRPATGSLSSGPTSRSLRCRSFPMCIPNYTRLQRSDLRRKAAGDALISAPSAGAATFRAIGAPVAAQHIAGQSVDRTVLSNPLSKDLSGFCTRPWGIARPRAPRLKARHQPALKRAFPQGSALNTFPSVPWITLRCRKTDLSSAYRGWLHISLKHFHPALFDNARAAVCPRLRPFRLLRLLF
jgi:hypothetical protein